MAELDPYFRGRYREKLGKTRASISEIERIVGPIRTALAEADRRLALLRAVEARYLDALGEGTNQ